MPAPNFYLKKSILDKPDAPSSSRTKNPEEIKGNQEEEVFKKFLKGKGLYMSACGHITHQECMHQRMKEGVDFCERCVRKYLPMNVQPSKDTSEAQDLANTSPSVNLNPTPLATSIFSFYCSHEINPLFGFFLSFLPN